MAMRIGYLLPTREAVMEGRPAAAPLINLAVHAESQGYDSVWIGDSLLARPRHEPLTMLAAAATRTRRVELGTAVFLPILRNPVVLAHQLATLDQISEGRLVLGAGIATDAPSVRDEFLAAGVPFEKRVGRLLEGLRLARALWTGEPVDWEGRWTVRNGTLGPVPYRAGGPPIWLAGSVPAAFERAARYFDGWFANGPDAAEWGRQWQQVQKAARAAGRDPKGFTGAIYLTLAIDENKERAEERLDAYLERYYSQPAAVMRRRQSCYAGPAQAAADWIRGYAEAGATHAVLRFTGDHVRQIDTFARMRDKLG